MTTDSQLADQEAREELHLEIMKLNTPEAEQRVKAVEKIKQLLPKVTDLNQPDEYGVTTIAMTNHLQTNPQVSEVISLLKSIDEKFKAANQSDRAALDIAENVQHGSNAELATQATSPSLENSENPELGNRSLEEKLYLAAEALNGPDAEYAKAVIEELLLKGRIELNLQDERGQTTLHLATQALSGPGAEHAEQVITLLLEKGSNPKIIDQERKTVLHLASEALQGPEAKHAVKVIQALLKKGMDPALSDVLGSTALDIAAQALNYPESAAHAIDAIKLFIKHLDHGPLTKSERLGFALRSVVNTLDHGKQYTEEAAELLFIEGIKDLDQAKDLAGRTTFHLASESLQRGGAENSARIIERLVKEGANPELKDKLGSTPRDLAEEIKAKAKENVEGATKIIKELDKRGANLEYAAKAIKELIKIGVPSALVDKLGSTPRALAEEVKTKNAHIEKYADQAIKAMNSQRPKRRHSI